MKTANQITLEIELDKKSYLNDTANVIFNDIFKSIVIPAGDAHMALKKSFLEDFGNLEQEAQKLFNEFETLDVLEFINLITEKPPNAAIIFLTLRYCKEINTRNASIGGLTKADKKYGRARKLVNKEFDQYRHYYKSKAHFAEKLEKTIKIELDGLIVSARQIEVMWLPKGNYFSPQRKGYIPFLNGM